MRFLNLMMAINIILVLDDGCTSEPTSWLTKQALDIQVVEPGCRAVRILPNLGELNFAGGAFPTLCDIINVKSIRQSDEKYKVIDAPNGVRVVR